MRNFVRSMLIAAFAMSGCYVEERPVAVTDAYADLIEVAPGVEVVADYDAPIFFADDYYWWSVGGVWYWSTWYRDGWSRAPYVPRFVAGIPHPESYTHYRPQGWTPRSGVARSGGAVRSAPTHTFGSAPIHGGPVMSRPAPHGGGGGHHR